ncbi:MAG: B12-binding domain-containing radical SAM protein [Candidatus Nealsonbacteria bacterium]|nr:B12-binding domain-containing radical SAM protein [Candidatus Nealsonbacteria bacterium]
MRIGLIAMSGIRACDAELLRLGLTLPGFVERSKTIASLPSLGLLTLAGMTPPEHECVYLEIEDVRKMGALPGGFDLVAISSFSAQMDEAYELGDRYREQRVPVVLGGLHVTALPDEAAEHCDAVVIGEGESVWLDVLGDAEAGRLKPAYRADGSFRLEDAPMPAFEMLEPERYNRLTVQASRGCPFQCEFCASSILLTDRYKQKPVEKVLAEIDRICEIWRRPFLEFADDNALVNKPYWKRLLAQLKTRHIHWFAETDVSVHEDDELLGLMREAGCAEVLVGLESPVEDGLAGLELKSDFKRRRWPQYKEAIARIQSHGIRVDGCFVIGLDGHTPAIFDEVYDFAVESELYDVQITLPTPFPGTPFYDRLRREDRLLFDGAWQRCTLFDVNYRPSHMSAEELGEGFRQLAVRVYSEEQTQWRRENFNRKYLKPSRSGEEVMP